MRVGFAKVGLVGLVVMVFGLATASVAAAEESHLFAGSFGEGELSLTAQSGVAVKQADGNVYVADTGHNRIVEYGPEGESPTVLATPTAPTFIALDNSSGDLYAVNSANQKITKLNSSGTPVASWGNAGTMEGFGEIAGLAVDPSGNLFVLGKDAKLHELDAAGVPIGAPCEVPYAGLGPVLAAGIGVDSGDHIYFVRGEKLGKNQLRSLSMSTSACVGLVEEWANNGNGGGYDGIAVDEADDSLFLALGQASSSSEPSLHRAGVGHYSASEEKLEEYFGFTEGEEGTELKVSAQLAVRSTNSIVYVVDPGSQYVAVFKPESVEPPGVTFEEPGAVSEVSGRTAHFKAEITLTGFEVKYTFHCDPGCSGSDLSGTLSASTATQTVEATAEALLPVTEYHVYITAENVNGAGGTVRAPEPPSEGLSFTTSAAAPSITEEVAIEVSETTAVLQATIDPGGAPTEYLVQYVTKAQFEASGFAGAAQTAPGSVPAGGATTVSVNLVELAPSTAYAFRFLATNVVEEVEGEPAIFTTHGPLSPPAGGCLNEIFRTEASATLPDCRAYEQSTPVDKNGGGLGAVPSAVQATEEPDSITSFTQAGIPGGVGGQDYSTYMSSRGTEAWSTQGLLPPQALGPTAAYLGLTPGGRYAVSDAEGIDAGGASVGIGLFRRDLRTGQMTTLVPYDIECGENPLCFHLAGASVDGTRIFFESTASLTGQTPPGQPNVFEWEEATGQVSLVDVNEAGEPLPEGGFAGPYDWIDEDLLVGGAERMYVGAIGAVSSDGSVAVYTERGEGEGHGQLYVRRGIGGPSPASERISAYRDGTSGPEEHAAFLGATPDGQYVFFKSKAALTADAYAGESGHESASLYRYDTATGVLLDLTPDPGEEREDGPGVEGMLGAGESGKVAYFVAAAVLTEEEGPAGGNAVAGQPNLYRWQEGFPVAFVATLKRGSFLNGSGDTRDWSPATEEPTLQSNSLARTARVSADGGTVVFSSQRALTGAPNRNADTCSGENGACAELFRYAAATRNLDCLSCDPSGARPFGAASLGAATIGAQDVPFVYAAPVLPRNLSASGNRFFFQTPDPLVAADGNSPGCSFVPQREEVTCMDVYEWESPGIGRCTQSTVNAAGGCLSLISTGESAQGSYFADADREGTNAYFFTSSQLVPVDGDHLYDVYDAREYGGLASQHPAITVPCESRQACEGPQASPETSSTPGTAGFVGPENQKAGGCKKGFVHKHGRCVRKSKHHRKTHHRRHKRHKKKHANAKQRAGRGRGGSK